MESPSAKCLPGADHVSIWQHVVATGVILGFIATGWLRLNDCDLFNPDSPRYLLYAQSLADTGQYRAIDTPGAPLYTWRPPGLPILLVPVLWFSPYDVVAAKWVVLLSGGMLLATVYAIVQMNRPGWSALAILLVVGSSPLLLSMATEVLSEVPYTLGVLAVLFWIGRWDQTFESRDRDLAADPGVPLSARLGSRGIPPWTAYSVAMIALAFTPIIRTVGVALIVAVGLWSLSRRRRWRFIPAVVIAAGGLVWLSWRSRSAPGSNYAGSLLQSIRDHGLVTVISESWRTVSFYAEAFPGVLLPGLTRGQPFYAPMIIGLAPALNLSEVFVGGLALIVTFCGIVGLWQQRSRSGAIGLLYLALYAACLTIWPWRHERFLWPVVPLIWAFVPAGCASIGRVVPQNLVSRLRPALLTVLIGFSVWQLQGCLALVMTNQRFLANRDAFYAEESPGFYFSDWRRAGSWIQKNTTPDSRLLTWQAAVGGTAHRFQRRVQFEAQTPEKMRQQIGSFPARHLVITTAQFGTGFGWPQVFADPAYSFKIVYQDRDVAVFEIGPNRTGSISQHGYLEWVKQQSAALDLALSRHPNRTDLIARQAELLQEAGQNDRAIKLLEDLIDRGMVTVRVCSSLGWLYLAEQKYEQAARQLELARGLPNAEPVAELLADGARRARERLQEKSPDPAIVADRQARRIQQQIAMLNLSAAKKEVDRALQTSPEQPALNYCKGYLHHLFDEREQALAAYQKAEKCGSSEATGKLELLLLEKSIAQSASSPAMELEPQIDPNSFVSHVRLAKLYDEHGWSGRAVATLELARQRFGDQPEILAPLAALYLRFAMTEQAAGLYRTAQQAWPHDESIRQGLATAEAALRVPRFSKSPWLENSH